MRFPKLVLPQFCKTPIQIELYREGISEDGEPLKAIVIYTTCNYQDNTKTILTDTKKLVQITGQAFFDGDICEELPVISGGEVTVFGVQRRITNAVKARNLDGTVNYTRLDLE